MDEPRCFDGSPDHAYARDEGGGATVLRSAHTCVLCGLTRLRYWMDGREVLRYARSANVAPRGLPRDDGGGDGPPDDHLDHQG